MKEDDFKKTLDDLGCDSNNYIIPSEAACSAEFPSGCILCEE